MSHSNINSLKILHKSRSLFLISVGWESGILICEFEIFGKIWDTLLHRFSFFIFRKIFCTTSNIQFLLNIQKMKILILLFFFLVSQLKTFSVETDNVTSTYVSIRQQDEKKIAAKCILFHVIIEVFHCYRYFCNLYVYIHLLQIGTSLMEKSLSLDRSEFPKFGYNATNLKVLKISVTHLFCKYNKMIMYNLPSEKMRTFVWSIYVKVVIGIGLWWQTFLRLRANYFRKKTSYMTETTN